MYSQWFHFIRRLAGEEPDILDSLTPEMLPAHGFKQKEGNIYESSVIGLHSDGSHRTKRF